MKNPDRALLVSWTADRMRLKIPSRRGDVDYFQRLQTAIADNWPDCRISSNARVASLLLEGGDVDERVLADLGASEGFFELEPEELPVFDRLELLAGRYLPRDAARGRGDYRQSSKRLAAMLLVVEGLRQLRRGEVLSPASSLFWYAYELLDRD